MEQVIDFVLLIGQITLFDVLTFKIHLMNKKPTRIVCVFGLFYLFVFTISHKQYAYLKIEQVVETNETSSEQLFEEDSKEDKMSWGVKY